MFKRFDKLEIVTIYQLINELTNHFTSSYSRCRNPCLKHRPPLLTSRNNNYSFIQNYNINPKGKRAEVPFLTTKSLYGV